MIRNLKALGLSLVAVFAMGALGASSASAVDLFTEAGAGNTALLTGVGHDHHFNAGGTTFRCTTSKFAATITNGDDETTVDVTYAGKLNHTPHNTDGSNETYCDATGGQITVDMNSCGYILTGETTGEHNGGKDATVWIYCNTPGDVIKITQPGTGATITVHPQTPTIGGVTYTNENHPGGAAVKVKATATGITYTCHGFACHFGPGTSGQNATYTGEVTMTGYEDLNGLPTPVIEGARVPISWS